MQPEERWNRRTWIDEDDAIVNEARYLGFKSTRDRIKQRFRTAIRVLIRNGDLERNGRQIRKA